MPTHYPGDEDEVRSLNCYIKLMRAASSMESRLTPSLTAAGLTLSQFGILEALHHLGPLHQKDLGKKLLLSGGNITMVVNNLERQGLVVRLKTGTDKRYVTVHLTWRGTDLIKRTFPGHLRDIQNTLNILTSDEQQRLGELCKIVGRQQRPQRGGSQGGETQSSPLPGRD